MMHIIAGKFKKRALIAPKTDKVRPTTSQLRETVFNICQLTIEGARFLDLFAGSGAMGLEALSRGCVHATFVEKSPIALAAIKKNIANLQVSADTLVYGEAVLKALAHFYKQEKMFEIIYADPPYGEGLSVPVLEYLDTHPLLTPEGTLFIEDARFEQPPLHHLQLIREREVGRAHLYEYQYRP